MSRTNGHGLSAPRWQRLLAIVLALLLLAGLNLGYTAYSDQRREDQVRRLDREREQAEREADRRWCDLLGTLDRAYTVDRPATELGRQVAVAIHTVLGSLNCKPK